MRRRKLAGREESMCLSCHRFSILLTLLQLWSAQIYSVGLWHLWCFRRQALSRRKRRGGESVASSQRSGRGREMSSSFRMENRFNEGEWNIFNFLIQVNLKTPDATVETEEQYRTKVCIRRVWNGDKIKTILQQRWRSGSRYQRSWSPTSLMTGLKSAGEKGWQSFQPGLWKI